MEGAGKSLETVQASAVDTELLSWPHLQVLQCFRRSAAAKFLPERDPRLRIHPNDVDLDLKNVDAGVLAHSGEVMLGRN